MDEQINEPTEDQEKDTPDIVKQRKRIDALEAELGESKEALGAYRTAEKHSRFANLLGMELAPGETIKGAHAFMVDAYDGDLSPEAISSFLVENGEQPVAPEVKTVIDAQTSIDDLDRVTQRNQPPSAEGDREDAYIEAYNERDAKSMIALSLEQNPI